MPNTKMKNNIVATSHHFVKHIGLPENRVMKVEKVERPEILADIEVNETEIFTRGKSEFLVSDKYEAFFDYEKTITHIIRLCIKYKKVRCR